MNSTLPVFFGFGRPSRGGLSQVKVAAGANVKQARKGYTKSSDGKQKQRLGRRFQEGSRRGGRTWTVDRIVETGVALHDEAIWLSSY